MKRFVTTLLLVWTVAGFALAQRTVTGTVTGDDGELLVGATVLLKGTSTGTRTDVSGAYALTIPAGDTANILVFSYTGYATQEVTLGTSDRIDVVLAAGQVLQEAVVTALGITRSEKALGYSVSQVQGEEVTRSGEVNVIQGLAAKTAGIQVVGSSGTPGASSKILIRGNSSFQLNQQPLIIVDNVPYDNSTNTVIGADYPFNPNLQGVNESNRALDINPEDIENISVLKGPSASALYGTRAANGVILITTKRGRQGLQVSYGVSYDISEVNKLPEVQTEFGQGGANRATAGGQLLADQSGSNPEGVSQPGATPNSWGARATESFDNFDNYFERGQLLNNNISIGGGTENTTFRFSYGNTLQTGIVPNTRLNRNTFRVNASTGTTRVRITANGAYSTTQDRKAQNGSNLSGVMLPLLRMPVDFDIRGGDGDGGFENIDGSQHSYFAPYDNPLWTAYRNPNESNVTRLTGALSLDYFATDWLTLTARVGTDQYHDNRDQIIAIGNNNFDPRGEVWEGNVKHEEINTDLLARASETFGDFSTAITVGSQLNHRQDDNTFSRGTALAVADFYNLSNASILYTDNQTYIRRLAGIFLTADIGYRDLVYLTVGGRNDWASTFGAEAKSSFFYPNASISFILSEVMPENDVLSYAKLRASFARAGREPDPFQLATYPSRTYFERPFFTDGFTDGNSFPYLGQNGFAYSNVLGNPELRPEVNNSYETGLDLRFLENRLNFNFTYYYSKSEDLLVVRPIASSSGFEFFTSNVGEMENQGIEIEADFDLLRYDNFTWNLGGNFTRNRNKVLRLAPGVPSFSIETAFTGIGSYAIEGQPYGAVFGTMWERNDDGQLIIGANGLPIRAAEEGFLGNPYPDWTAGIRNEFRFFGVSLSALLDIREGGILWNGTWARMNNIGRTKESGDGRSNFYVIEGVKQGDGTPNDIRVGAYDYFRVYKGDAPGYAVENAIQDGSWVRLREVTLSYTLPTFSRFVKGLTFFVTGRNLWLSTDYTGVDPETSLTGAGSNIGGFDYFNMPGTRSYIFGLRSNF
jgi:TonB-linked SusC/RagA family outer membrane protein